MSSGRLFFAVRLKKPPDLHGTSVRLARDAGIAGGYMSLMPQFTGKQYGFSFFDEDLKPHFNTPEGVDFFEYYTKLARDAGAPGEPGMHWIVFSF